MGSIKEDRVKLVRKCAFRTPLCEHLPFNSHKKNSTWLDNRQEGQPTWRLAPETPVQDRLNWMELQMVFQLLSSWAPNWIWGQILQWALNHFGLKTMSMDNHLNVGMLPIIEVHQLPKWRFGGSLGIAAQPQGTVTLSDKTGGFWLYWELWSGCSNRCWKSQGQMKSGTNLNAGVGEAWAGQTRLRLSPAWKLWSCAVTVENLGRELPMGSEQRKEGDNWHWPEWWHGAGLSWTGHGQGPGLASDQVRNGALSRKLGGGSSNGL